MLRRLALSLACLLLCAPAGHAAQLGFTCTTTYTDTDAMDHRTIHVDTVARSVRDEGIVTIDGAANGKRPAPTGRQCRSSMVKKLRTSARKLATAGV